jgi:transposase
LPSEGKLVAGRELCRRFMQIPGVGPVAALSFMTAIDDLSRLKRSRDVAAYFGSTSRLGQSGSSIDVQGGSARRATATCGSRSMRRQARCSPAKNARTRSRSRVGAKRSSRRKAAVARKLAVIAHAMWVDGTFHCGDPTVRATDVGACAAARRGGL